MVNVLVDMNLLFHRWVHFLSGKDKNRIFLENDYDAINMIHGVHSSLMGDIYKYKAYVDRIFLITDSNKSSWRKHIKVEGDKFYKSGAKDYKFDYKKFLLHMDAYCNHMREQGLYVLQFNHSEGDDLIYMLSDKLYSQGQSSVILTADSDLRQLIRSEDKKFIYLFDTDRNKRKHVIDKMLDVDTKMQSAETTVISSLDGIDEDFGGIFDHTVEEAQSDIFANTLNIMYGDSVEIDPNTVIFNKMLAGDKSDGVPAAYRYMYGKKNPKLQNFTELRAEKVWEKIGAKPYKYFIDLYDNEELRIELAKLVMEEVKIEEDEDTLLEISKGIRRNLKFTFLNKIVYHPDHLKHMEDYLDSVLEDRPFAIEHKKAIANGIQNTMLEGTIYEISNSNSAVYYDQKR